jgi:hypothetical protein
VGKPEVIRTHPENLHRRFMGISVREVGPRHSEFDYVCLIAKFWRFYFIVNHYWSWSLTRIKFEWWPKRRAHTGPAINRTIRWPAPKATGQEQA